VIPLGGIPRPMLSDGLAATGKPRRGLIIREYTRMSGNWIAGAVKNKGSLHRSLHVPKGDIIPQSKIMKAEHADNPALAKKARLAETLEHLHKRCNGGPV